MRFASFGRFLFGLTVLVAVLGVACGGSDSPEDAPEAGGQSGAIATATETASSAVLATVTPSPRPEPPTVVARAATTEELTAQLQDAAVRLYDHLARMTGRSSAANCGSPCAVDFDFENNLEGAKDFCFKSVDKDAFRSAPGYSPSEHAALLAVLDATCTIVGRIEGNDVRGQALALGALSAIERFIPEDQRFE